MSKPVQVRLCELSGKTLDRFEARDDRHALELIDQNPHAVAAVRGFKFHIEGGGSGGCWVVVGPKLSTGSE